MKIELDFSASKSCDDIVLEIYCNDKKISESVALPTKQTVCINLSEDPADHCLRMIMRGKTNQHTVLDSNNEIVDDVWFSVDRLEFEDLDMREIFCQGCKCYTHSFNQNQPSFVDEFYGYIGCNGTIEIKFSTPIFLWLNDYLD